MRKYLQGVAWLLAALVIAAAPAWAQEQSGSILVKAVDPQGAVMPGATVTISSPVLPNGQTGTTDTGGAYRFVSLPPGAYTVKVELQGFQTVTQEGVVVGAGSTTPLDISMKVGNITETTVVSGVTPTVDTTTANVGVHLDQKILDTTPSGRDIWSIIEYKVPGLVMATPDVGGNQGGLQRDISARGTSGSQNVQMLNGVNVDDPAAIGFAGYYYDPSALSDIQVTSGDQDITDPSGGVLINMVSKSGTNKFNGQVLETYQGKNTQGNNIDTTLLKEGIPSGASNVDHLNNFNAQAGGPILKNKLFYFAALNDQRTAVHFAGFPSPLWLSQGGADEPDTTNITSIFTDPTYQMNSANRFQTTVSRQVYDKPNRGADTSGGTQDPNSVWHEHDILAVYQGLWNTVINSRQFLTTQVSYNSIQFPLNLKTTDQTLLDQATQIRTRANTIQQVMYRRRLEASTNWQYFIPKALGGRHEIRAGFDNAYTPETVDLSINGNVRDTYRSVATSATALAGPVSVQLFNTPLEQKRAVMDTALYAQDTYSYKRLTAVGGVRWERDEGWLPAQSDPPGQYLLAGTPVTTALGNYTLSRSFPAVHDVPLWHNAGPRGSVIYDLFGNGRTALKFSIARYYDQIGTGTPGGVNPNGTVSQTYAWNDNGDLVFQPNELGSPLGPISAPLPGNLLLQNFRFTKRPYRNEITAGVQHQLIPDLGVTATYIQRHEHNQQATLEEAIPFSYYTPVTVVDPGRDGIIGTSDDQTLTVYKENLPLVTSVTGPANDNRADMTYHGLDLTVEKRYSNKWTMVGGYTYSHTTFNGTTSITSPNSFINIIGPSTLERRHNFKLTGSYLLPYDIQFGANLRFLSGQPQTRTDLITGLPQAPNGLTVNAEAKGDYVLPWINTADIRIGKVFHIGGNDIEGDVDVYNVTNSNAVFSIRTSTGTLKVTDYTTGNLVTIPQFGSPTGVLGPRIVRLGITYKFGQK